MIHKNPVQASLWKLLADVLMKHFPHHGRAVTNAASYALIIDTVQKKVTSENYLIHKNPVQANLWKLLADVLLKHFPHHGRAVTNAAKCSLLLDTEQKRVTS